MGEDFNYADEFLSLDLEAVKMIYAIDDRFPRLVACRFWALWTVYDSHGWHASTYQVTDGRGGGGAGSQRCTQIAGR